jgi:hypothetical protein
MYPFFILEPWRINISFSFVLKTVCSVVEIWFWLPERLPLQFCHQRSWFCYVLPCFSWSPQFLFDETGGEFYLWLFCFYLIRVIYKIEV